MLFLKDALKHDILSSHKNIVNEADVYQMMVKRSAEDELAVYWDFVARNIEIDEQRT